jgi:hypothetical protein
MKNSRLLLDHLESILLNPERGIIGIVDELVETSREHDLQVQWQAGCCSVVLAGGEPSDRIEVPMRKSVVRAALARIAALCNDRNPGSVSPYRGQGEITIDSDPSRTIRADFVNTQEAVSLELGCVSPQTVSLFGVSQIKSPD